MKRLVPDAYDAGFPEDTNIMPKITRRAPAGPPGTTSFRSYRF